MARQGCLCQWNCSLRSMLRALAYCCAILFSSLALMCGSSLGQIRTTQENQPVAIDTNSETIGADLQLVWSAPRPTHWHVQLSIVGKQDGKLFDLENYCDAESTTGAFAADGRSVVFRPRVSVSSGEFRVRFDGNPESKLAVHVAASNQEIEGIEPSIIRVADLVAGTELNSQQNSNQDTQPAKDVSSSRGSRLNGSWSLRHQGFDPLQIRFSQNQPHCLVGQPIEFVVHAVGAKGAADEDLDEIELIYELHRVSDRKVIDEQRLPFRIDANGISGGVQVSSKRPEEPGVYEIRCRVVGSEKRWSRLRRSRPVLYSASTPILVVPNSVQSKREVVWERIGEIQPNKRPGWELNQWLPTASVIGKRPSRGPGLQQAKHDQRAVSLLDPKGTYATGLPEMEVGKAHRITIRYPAGQRLRVKVELSSSDRFDENVESYVLTDAWSLGSQEQWQTQSVVHYPQSSTQYIRLTNVSETDVASFASVSVATGQFSSGTTETETQEASSSVAKSRTAALQIRNLDWVVDSTPDLESGSLRRLAEAGYVSETRAMHRFYVAFSRLSEYARLAGYNGLVVPANQGGRSWYDSRLFAPQRKRNPWWKHRIEQLALLANQSELRVFVGFDPSMALADVEHAMQAGTQRTNGFLRTSGGHLRIRQYRLIDEQVQQSVLQSLQELEGLLISHSCYAGIALSCGERSHCQLVSDDSSDESKLRRFALDAKHPGAAGDLQVLTEWARADGQEAFKRWCVLRSTAAYERMAGGLRGKLLLTNCDSRIRSNPSIGLIPVARLHPASMPRTGTMHRDQPFSAAMIGLVNSGKDTDLIEHGPMIRDEVTRAIALHDPEILIVAQQSIPGALENECAAALNAFSILPAERMNNVMGVDPGSQSTLVRYGYREGKPVALFLNTAPWTTDIEVPCDTSISLAELGNSSNVSKWSVEGNALRVRLLPGRMLALTSEANATANPFGLWSSRVSGGKDTLDQIKERVTTVVERIGSLSKPQTSLALNNGGFELAAGVGIPGWMHTQHPNDAVRIDKSEAVEGRQSVLLTTDDQNSGRTWMVSEQLQPPQTGRLAISLACRGALVGGSTTETEAESDRERSPHRLRISIEGTRFAEPVRNSREFEVPRDGKWQPRVVVLEASGIDPTRVDSIRLTIDSLSPGRVWIDDVQLHQWFPLSSERRDLQGQAFMAVQGLQRGNLTPASQLLNNDWAQHLLAQKPPVVPVSKPRVVLPVPKRVEPPSVADRIRGWLPRPLRF